VAACDPAGMLAYPYATVPAGRGELAALLALVRELEPLEVIVGLPRSLSGGEGPAAAKNRGRALALASALTASGAMVPVRLLDERLTTVSASRQLRESGRRVRDQRSVIDSAAAVTILEHALAAERAQGTPVGELVSPGRADPQAPDEPGPDEPAEGEEQQ